MKVLNRHTEVLSVDGRRYTGKVYSIANPKYYKTSDGNYYSIDLNYSASKSNSNISSYVLFDKNINSVGIRTDNNTTKYVGVRPDETQTIGSQQYEWTIEDINVNGNTIPININTFNYNSSSLVSSLGNIEIQSTKNSLRQMVRYTGSIDDFKITYKLHLEGLELVNDKYTENTIVRNTISQSLIDCGNVSGSQYNSLIDSQITSESILSTYFTDDTLIINPKFNPNPYYDKVEMSSSEFTISTSSFSTIIRDSETFWEGDNANDYMSSIYVKDNMMLRFRDFNLAEKVNGYLLSLLNAEMDGNYIRIKDGKKVGSFVYLHERDTSYITLTLDDITHISSSYRYKNFDDWSHTTMSYSDIVDGIRTQLVDYNEITASTSYYKPIGESFQIKDSNNDIKYIITPPLLLDSNYEPVSEETITTHTLKDNGDGTYEYIKYPDKISVPSNTNYIDASTIYTTNDFTAYEISSDGYFGGTSDPWDSPANGAWSSTSPHGTLTGTYFKVVVRQNIDPAVGKGGIPDFRYYIYRSFMEFDTSTISATVHTASLYLYGQTAGEDITFGFDGNQGNAIRVVSASYSDDPYVSSSAYYDAINTGSYYDYVDSNIIVSASQYNSMSLNSNARTNIQSLDKFQVGLIEAYSDYANDKNNTLDDWQDGMQFYSAEAAGATDPYLYVVWDEPEIPAVLHLKSGKINIIGGKMEIV